MIAHAIVRALAVWMTLVWLALAPALAQSASPQVTERTATLLSLLRSGEANTSDFAPAFVEQVPLDRLNAIAAELRTINGAATSVEDVSPEGSNGATMLVGYERAVVTVRFALEPIAPHRLIGLLVTNVARRNDSLTKVAEDLRGLSGRTSLLVTELDAAKRPLIEHNAEVPLATASQFKLFVLAELARQIASDERRWSDVVPIGPPSLPSGVTQTWPTGAPATLSTLATQMMSISDNTAADTLLVALGRGKVDAMRASVGATPGALPVLTTREAFALKMATNADRRARWVRGSVEERRALLALKEPASPIDLAQLVVAPLHVDTVEWPATGREIVAVLDRLRVADRHTLDILAVAPGLAPAERDRFAYAGFKGGSESGVIALAWLLRTRDGRWFAVAGAWSDASAPVDNAKFTALMARAVALVR